MEGRGGGCEVAKVLHSLSVTYTQTDSLTNWVVEELSLLKKSLLIKSFILLSSKLFTITQINAKQNKISNEEQNFFNCVRGIRSEARGKRQKVAMGCD